MRRDLGTVAKELSLLGILQRQDCSPCPGLRMGRKRHVLPCGMLHGGRRLEGFKQMSASRGACEGPNMLSVAGACTGIAGGLY